MWGLLFVPAWILLAKIYGLYDRDQQSLRHLTLDELPSLIAWATSGTALLALWLEVAPPSTPPATELIRAWAVACVAVFAFRGLTRIAWRRVMPRERMLIVGAGAQADSARRKLELFGDIHVDVVGSRPELTLEELADPPPWLHKVDRLLLAPTIVDESLISALLAFCRREQIRLSVIPPARGLFGTAVQLNRVADMPLVEYNTWHVSRSTLLLKRVIDIAICAPMLVLAAPIFLLIAIAIKLDDGGRVTFSQVRASQHGRPFRMLKFRTMVVDAEELLEGLVSFDELPEPMFKLREDPRVTRVGRLLRRTSLDELPQLWNILRGQMTLVGPRPEQIELVERYGSEHMFRLSVKPGLTGPMQVLGRGHLTFEERLTLEREYIEGMSLRRDLRILALTASAIVSKRGAF